MYRFDKTSPENFCFVVNLFFFLFRSAYELLCFWMQLEGIEIVKIVDQCNSLRRRKGVHNRRSHSWNLSLFAMFQDRRSQKNSLNDELVLCGVWWCSTTIFMASISPKLHVTLIIKMEIVFARTSLRQELVLVLCFHRVVETQFLTMDNRRDWSLLLFMFYPIRARLFFGLFSKTLKIIPTKKRLINKWHQTYMKLKMLMTNTTFLSVI